MRLGEQTEACLALVWLAAVDSDATATADIGQTDRHTGPAVFIELIVSELVDI